MIVRETPDYLVVDKPPGVPTVPTRYNWEDSLTKTIKKCQPRAISAAGLYVTSRLDVGTHGLLVLARSRR